MDSNVSITRGDSFSRLEPKPRVNREFAPAETEPKVDLSSINSTKELQQVEQQGGSVSITDEQLVKAIEKAIKAIQGRNTSLDFSVHEKTRQIMVKVKDKETGEVIREIPPEKTMDLVARMWEMAGILIDERR